MKRNEKWTRNVLARNLVRLMDRPDAKKISTYKVAGYRKGEEQGNHPLSPKTVQRMRKGEHDVTLDHLQAIADFFMLEPWQLLVPNFDAQQPPHLALTDTEREAYARMEASIAVLQQLHAPIGGGTNADEPEKKAIAGSDPPIDVR